jgi:hypothetical protein
LQAATIHDGDDEKLRRRYAVTVRWRVVQRRKNVVAGIDGVGRRRLHREKVERQP